MSLQEDITESRDFEMHTYLNSMQAMYNNAVLQNGEIYDIALQLTNNFTDISRDSILADSRIIKTLRYSVAPSISQMKFGQFFGLDSVDQFENARAIPGTDKFTNLSYIAGKISKFAREHLDKSRFIWLSEECADVELAHRFAKNWTCSIAADQNAQTAYRNWRREQQELAVVTKLIASGYVKSQHRGTISKDTDINIGEYTQEMRVQGRTVQKADVVFRSKTSKKLVLVEAKAVGVKLDATKRIKECCDKAHDWMSSSKLNAPVVVAVIAGFFTSNNISNLQASNVTVIWEHNLSQMDLLA